MILLFGTAAVSWSRKPRASGDDPTTINGETVLADVNPARAGMIPCGFSSISSRRRKPRASGDDPTLYDQARAAVP